MDAQAIEKIQSTAISAHGVKIEGLMEAVVHKDLNVADLEQYAVHRRRFRGLFATSSIDSFHDYCKEHAAKNCFIDPDNMSAKSIFDLGSIAEPGHCEHTGELQLEKNKPYEKLLDINETRMSQRDMANWLQDWSHYLVAKDKDDNVIQLPVALQAVLDINIASKSERSSSESNFSRNRSTLESIEATSQHELPSHFEFTCTPYNNLEERAFTLQLSVVAGDRPQLVLRIMELEHSQELIAKEFQGLLEFKMKDEGVHPIIGRFNSKI